MRIIFMGTPDFAVPTLRRIAAAGHALAAVYTQPPRPAGRGMAPLPSPVHQAADALGLPVETPERLTLPDIQARFAHWQADVAVVVAYGLILPEPVLAAPAHGCLNLHGSLLPRWRGAAPLQRAIMAGDRQTGVMVMRMDKGLDTGPVAMTERVDIGTDETTRELHDRLAVLGADLMVRALDALAAGALAFVPQPAEGVTYAAKIDKAEARIDWARPADEIHNRIRGLSPFPGAWCEMPGGKGPERVKILHATRADGGGVPGTVLDDRLTIACGAGAVRLLRLQRAGGRAVDAAEFRKGFSLPTGTVIG